MPGRWWIVTLIALIPFPPTFFWAIYLWLTRLKPRRKAYSVAAWVVVILLAVWSWNNLIYEAPIDLPPRQSGLVGIPELRRWECGIYTEHQIQGAHSLTVEIVPCEGEHRFRILKVIDLRPPIAGLGTGYPGNSEPNGLGITPPPLFEAIAARNCPAGTLQFMSSTKIEWDHGERFLLCTRNHPGRNATAATF